MVAVYQKVWDALFLIKDLNYPIDKPLSSTILENFDQPITKRLLYIHSMETFICYSLKKASL